MRTILVSGAGSGIGRAICQVMAQASADNHLILIGRNIENLRQTQSGLCNQQQHEVLAVDVREQAHLRSAFREIRLESKNLVAVVSNAGVGGENHAGPDDRWQEVLDINLNGSYYLVREAYIALKASTEAYKHVVFMSSILRGSRALPRPQVRHLSRH